MRLKIIHHNVRNWVNPLYKNVLSNIYLKEDPDVITVNSHGIIRQDKHVKLFNYSGYTKNRELNSGVAILVKSSIPHTFHTDTINNNIMAVSLFLNHTKLTIVTFYRPFRQDSLPLVDLKKFINFGNPTLIMTDANVKNTHYGHTTTNEMGILLERFNQLHNLHFLGPRFNTFFSHNAKGKPDLIFGNTALLQLAYDITEGPRTPASDHIPVITTISTSPLAIPTKPRYNYNRANWEEFKTHMDTLDLPNIINKNSNQIDTLWDQVINHIKVGANLHIPKTTHKIIPALSQSNRTKTLLRIYNNRHEMYKQNMTIERAQILNTIKNHIKSSLHKDLCDYWSKRIEHIEEYKIINDPKNMYGNIKKLMGSENRNLGTFLIHRGREVHDHKEQADIFAETWEQIMKPNTPRDTPEVQQNIEEVNNWYEQNQQIIEPYPTINLNKLEKSHPLIKPITLIEVSSIFKKIKSKATGPQEISKQILENTPIKTGITITRLFNASLATGYYPKCFKQANIFLIHKPGKPATNPTSYRPIAIINLIAKILEKIIAKRLRTYLESTLQMNPTQYGFRQGRSTENIIYTTFFYLDSYHKLKKKTATASLDVEKAFDRVWHKGLTYKIFKQYNIPIVIKKFISHFISDRKYNILIGHVTSRQLQSEAGVPQGSALSPTLYTLYTNDTPNPKDNRTIILQYADDITILTQRTSIQHLRTAIQEELIQIDNYQAKWLIKTNKQKSNIVMYHTNIRTIHGLALININGGIIPFSQNTNILGVKFDYQLNMRNHIDTRIQMAKFTLSRLNRFKTMKTNLQFMLFQTLCLSQIMFSPTALIFPKTYGMDKLQKIQNKAIRQIHSIDWFSFTRNLDLHNLLDYRQTTEILYQRFLKTHLKTLEINTHIFNKINRELGIKRNRLLDLIDHPPQNILQ